MRQPRLLRDACICSAGGDKDENAAAVDKGDGGSGKVLLRQIIDALEIFLRYRRQGSDSAEEDEDEEHDGSSRGNDEDENEDEDGNENEDEDEQNDSERHAKRAR